MAQNSRYQRGKIYKIQSDSHKQVYIGSTTRRTLAQRMSDHCGDYRRYLGGGNSKYVTSFELLAHIDARIVLIESFPCGSKDELRAREQYWIDSIPDTVNKCRAYGTDPEYQAKYWQKNKEKLVTKHAQYYQQNREAILEKALQYNQGNKETKAAYDTQRYQQNRVTISARHKAKFNCECGGKYTYSGKSAHYRTGKHRLWEESQKIQEDQNQEQQEI